MKKVLLLDRWYTTRLAKSDNYEIIMVALSKKNKIQLEKEGYNVVGCFEEDYDQLPVADYPGTYLLFSFDSDRFLKRYNLEKRKEILGKEISFWSNILDTYKPSFIINEVCTIEWMEVLYIEALKRGIKYHTFLFGQIPHKTYWLDSPFNSTISQNRLDVVEITQELRNEAVAFCDKIKNKPEKPFYAIVKKHNKFKVFLSSIKRYIIEKNKESKHRGFLYEYYSGFRKQGIDISWKALYKSHDKLEKRKGIEYVFYPLHYEPESTLSYFSEYYADQASTIKQIAHCLKTNQILIVKEHPQQLDMLLGKRFQDVKKQCPNVMYLRGDVNSFDVLKQTNILITLTGTGGYEAMITGIPVIVLGDVFYNKCKSVNYCNSFREVKHLLHNDSYVMPNEEYSLDFIIRFMGLQNDFFPYYINDGYEESDRTNMIKLIETL